MKETEAVAVRDSTPHAVQDQAALVVALVLLAVILVVSARSQPVVEEARLGRRVELVELIRTEEARVAALAGRVEELSTQLAAYEQRDRPDEDVIVALQTQLDEIAGPAGLTAVRGPGLVVTLSDSTLSAAAVEDLNALVIHEQDLQAVINALWAGGAEAVSVNGQRVLATTAIRCVGNTLLLHGGVYSPPYRIAAVGDQIGLRAALGRDPAVERFVRDVATFELGYEVVDEPVLELPAFEGVSALRVARPADVMQG